MQFLKCVFIKLFSQVSAVKEQRTFSTAGLEVRFCVALPPTVPQWVNKSMMQKSTNCSN